MRFTRTREFLNRYSRWSVVCILVLSTLAAVFFFYAIVIAFTSGVSDGSKAKYVSDAMAMSFIFTFIALIICWLEHDSYVERMKANNRRSLLERHDVGDLAQFIKEQNTTNGDPPLAITVEVQDPKWEVVISDMDSDGNTNYGRCRWTIKVTWANRSDTIYNLVSLSTKCKYRTHEEAFQAAKALSTKTFKVVVK